MTTWEPKRRGLVSGHGPAPTTPPPPVSSVMPDSELNQLRRAVARLESLAATFRENGLTEWAGVDIAHMIHANLEGETR